jgi:hypothetical protein
LLKGEGKEKEKKKKRRGEREEKKRGYEGSAQPAPATNYERTNG